MDNDRSKQHDRGGSVSMRHILNLMILFMLLSAGIGISSAANELPFKRVISVNEWGNAFGSKESIDQIINNVSYMKGDLAVIHIGSEYYEAVRDPAKASWDSRASWNMLEYAIEKAHSKNIQLHVSIAINSVGLASRAEYRLWNGRVGTNGIYTKYNVNSSYNTPAPTRLEIANPIVANYEIDLITFIAKHYPTLDGIHIEEPFYTGASYSQEIIDRVKAKYNGYDIVGKNDYANPDCRGSSIKGTNQTLCPTFSKIYSVERDVFIEFFTKLSASVKANKDNPNLLFSANAANGYRPLHGFDPSYMSDNHLLDWYVAQTNTDSLPAFKSSIERLNLEVNDIPVVPVSFITWSSIYPTANPAFLDEVEYTCEYGGNAVWVFAYAWRTMIVEGNSAYEGLHNLPPSSLCDQSTIVSTPRLSIPAGNYSSPQNISISTTTPGATISYTLDSTTPSETSPIYSNPILISSTKTLKARAWKTNLTPSTITTATYIITTQVLSSIIISPPSASMTLGSTQTFTAYSKDQSGNPMATTITWTSSNESVGTITPSGIFTALAEGTTTITAVSGSVNGTATVVITSSQPINNLINNPGFELGPTSWFFYSNGAGNFTVGIPFFEGTKAANLTLISSGTNIQLYQTGITLVANTSYRLSFAAYSTTGHDFSVRLFKHVSPYTAYMPEYMANLSTNWQTFTTKFNSTGFTDTVNDGRLMFWLSQFGSNGDTYYIDNIRLEKVVRNSISDLNNDEVVDIKDLEIIYFHFYETTTDPYPNYDLNTDGKVDIFDMILVSNKIT